MQETLRPAARLFVDLRGERDLKERQVAVLPVDGTDAGSARGISWFRGLERTHSGIGWERPGAGRLEPVLFETITETRAGNAKPGGRA